MPEEPLENRIVDFLRSNPGKKAHEIAEALGAAKGEVNSCLHDWLQGQAEQNNEYKWRLAGNKAAQQNKKRGGAAKAPRNSELAKLCRYYLSCLGYDSTGISTLYYKEVRRLPQSADDFADAPEAQAMLDQMRTERGRYGLYFGYPTALRFSRAQRGGREGYSAEPLLLYPIEQSPEDGRLLIDLEFPIVNQTPFRRFSNAEADALMDAMVSFERDLGFLSNQESPDLAEVAMRLRSVRSTWPWKEKIDPDKFDNNQKALSDITEEGIFNRPVIIMGERSPFTLGLENELRDLAALSPEEISGTALGKWLAESGAETPGPPENEKPLIEVLPMNSEQRRAVESALANPVTVITGPPGTGKSQAVTNLLANAAWRGKRILFASKNNKAVDVVNARVNGLGTRPVLLRVGAQSGHQHQLAEILFDMASATSDPSDLDDFNDAFSRYEILVREQQAAAKSMEQIMNLRNEAGRLESGAEDARRRLSPELFQRAGQIDLKAVTAAVEKTETAMKKAVSGDAPVIERLFWFLFSGRRFRKLSQSMAAGAPFFDSIECPLPKTIDEGDNFADLGAFLKDCSSRLEHLHKAKAYREGLSELQSAKPLEKLAREDSAAQKKIAEHSENLWNLWLKTGPSRRSEKERTGLQKHQALLKMVIEAGAQSETDWQVRRQYNDMLKEISHLLPCWAVTSLSARGRIPFEPGMFDIVVFDEASQCDVASALPLLYRAKSAVVIGDPKQLPHISGLPRGQDQILLKKHGLLEKRPHWSYKHQSLFGLASVQVTGGSVVTLIDHHRSHADIINFSNGEFYEGRLRVATRHDNLISPAPGQPGVRWIDIRGRAARPNSGGAVNRPEAEALVKEIRSLVLEKGYEGSIGAVTPFRAQANTVTELVNRDAELSSVLNQRNFLSDTVHKFQGDERDIMFFSPVVSEGIPQTAFDFLRSNGNLFNVAVTRARAQLVVAGDLSACGACEIGYLSRFAQYVKLLETEADEEDRTAQDDIGAEYPAVARPESVSDWEKVFYRAAYAAGLRLIPQYQEEKYALDFLLLEGDRRLNIEIDGERHHRNWTGDLCLRDKIRNQRLFELGYDVMRFWVYEVRDDMEGCIRRIHEWRGGAPAP